MSQSTLTTTDAASPSSSPFSLWQQYKAQADVLARSQKPAYGFCTVAVLGFPVFLLAKQRHTDQYQRTILATSPQEARVPPLQPVQSNVKAAPSTVAAQTVQQLAKGRVYYAPHFLHIGLLLLTCGAGGAIVQDGDALNGSGVISAWTSLYLLRHGFNSLRHPNFYATGVTAGALGLLAVHGTYYFSRTGWRGWIPWLHQAEIDKQYDYKSKGQPLDTTKKLV